MAQRSQVAIVGAGPTGLMLAGDLAEAGIDVVILEKRNGQSNLTRAFAVHARTLETLDMRGVADRLLPLGSRGGEVRLVGDVGIKLENLPSRFNFLLTSPQYHTENVLRERALAAGAEIRHGHEVTGLDQDSEAVHLEVTGPDGSTHRHSAAYVVGTDGAHSTIRRLIEVPFPGRLAAPAMILADVRFSDPPKSAPRVNANRAGFAFIAPFGDGYHRIVCRANGDTRPDDAPVTEEEIRALLISVFGTTFGMSEPRWVSRFHSDERQADRYRVGRVLLAGDAAHVHTPAGGQGMNVGIQDAANLAWKLTAELQGWAVPGLLDSYEAERHPIGAAVMTASSRLFRAGSLRSLPAIWLRNIVIATALAIPAVQRKAAGMISGIGVDLPVPQRAGPDAGKRAPDLPLRDEGRLFEALRPGRFALVTDDPDVRPPAEIAHHTDVVCPAGPEWPAILVRPDGYILWSGREKGPPVWMVDGKAALAGV